MVNRILLATSAVSFLFLISAAIILAFSVVVGNIRNNPTPVDGIEATRNLIYRRFPLEAGIANAVMIFLTFLLIIPGLITSARGILKISGIAITICGIFTLGLGAQIWMLTLDTRKTMAPVWQEQTAELQGMMENSFTCCGFINSTSPAFVTTDACPSPAAAALMRGCAGPIASFANQILDDIFTTMFGFVGIDALLALAIACLLRDRKERERYRHIDEKNGFRTL